MNDGIAEESHSRSLSIGLEPIKVTVQNAFDPPKSMYESH